MNYLVCTECEQGKAIIYKDTRQIGFVEINLWLELEGSFSHPSDIPCPDCRRRHTREIVDLELITQKIPFSKN